MVDCNSFCRWLAAKYPRTLNPVHESDDASSLCDYLYVDMNGVIHPCAHPEDRAAPPTEDEIFVDVMLYVDRLVAATRPTTLVYLAIDGVAPRAKMNQQRARRWKAAKEAREKRELEAEVRAEVTGAQPPPPPDEFDSNVITPGTRFMRRLGQHIERAVAERQQRNEWGAVAVVVSDDSVPGEGEHKIMAFVRSLRQEPDYDPNTTHVLHGLDADLIMLGLATHEVNFNILREEVLFGRAAKEYEERAQRERLAHANLTNNAATNEKGWIYAKPLQLFKISTLREYLDIDLYELRSSLPANGIEYDFEKVVDDFVFLCFFCGNDFLPHLPSLDIREGALDLLINLYRTIVPRLGYVTDHGGHIDLRKLKVFLRELGAVEDTIFKKRKKSDDDDRARRQGSNHRRQEFVKNNQDVEATVKSRVAEKTASKLDACNANFVDTLRLGDVGWKNRYYGSRYVERDLRLGGGTDALLNEYCRGLDWVLRYYYAGCCAWGWYFPFHYAPFASDLASFLDRLCAEHDHDHPEATEVWAHETVSEGIELGQPFTPLQQLMAVLPAASAHAIPAACRELMTSEASPVQDFYTDDVDVDPNGKAMPWLHVVLLPFVDEARLIRALDTVIHNVPQQDDPQATDALIVARAEHPLAPALGTLSQPPPAGLITGDLAPPPAGMTVPNMVAVASIKYPPHRNHLSKLLPGAILPPRVLTDQQDLSPRAAPRLGRRGTPQIANLAYQSTLAAPVQPFGASGFSAGINSETVQALAGQRSWGTFEPAAPLKRSRPQDVATSSSSKRPAIDPSSRPAAPSRHAFAHPQASLSYSSAHAPRAGAPVLPKPPSSSSGRGPFAPPHTSGFSKPQVSSANTAPASSLRAQLAQALKNRKLAQKSSSGPAAQRR